MCTCIINNNRHDSGRIRGYAHIDFFDEDKATKGLTRDGYTMGTRCVKRLLPTIMDLSQRKFHEYYEPPIYVSNVV